MTPAKIQKVAIGLVIPNEYNPNEMSDDLMNELAEDLSKEELDQPIVVREVEGKFVIVDGEHRWRTSRALGYEEVLVSIKDISETEAKIATIRRNTIHGNLDPLKFTQLVQSIAQDNKSTIEEVRTRMAMRQKDFDKTYLGMTDKKEELAATVAASKDNTAKLHAVANLSQMVREIITNYGDTLGAGFVCFAFNGSTHLMVSMDTNLKNAMTEFVSANKEDELSKEGVSVRLAEALRKASND